MLATLKSETSVDFAKQQLLIFEEGRKVQQDWIFAKSPQEAVKKNIISGLTTFNNKANDLGWIYPNLNHGFVDPFSGVMLWLGILAVLCDFVRKKIEPFPLLMLSGFFVKICLPENLLFS